MLRSCKRDHHSSLLVCINVMAYVSSYFWHFVGGTMVCFAQFCPAWRTVHEIHCLLYVKWQIINTFHAQLWSRGQRKDTASATFGASSFCANGEKMLNCIWFCFFFFFFKYVCIILFPFGAGDWVEGLLCLMGLCSLSSVTERLMYHTLGPDESSLSSVQRTPGRC